ncbi:hypothetical protein WJX82_008296 [Trebouxia sp. C0006]
MHAAREQHHTSILHSSAAAGHECVCLANLILVTPASPHRQQDRFYLSSFRYAYTHAPRLCTVAPGASLISQSYKPVL